MRYLLTLLLIPLRFYFPLNRLLWRVLLLLLDLLTLRLLQDKSFKVEVVEVERGPRL